MYSVEYLEDVVKDDIPKLPKRERKRIKQAIENRLIKDPIHFGTPLKYSFKNCRRMRLGFYRIIFQLKSKKILIVKIGHRKEVYKKN